MGLLLFLMPVNYPEQKSKLVEAITTFLCERFKGFGKTDWRELSPRPASSTRGC